ncbi:hypothetical protein ACNKHT_22450 [Shigella flexneri]
MARTDEHSDPREGYHQGLEHADLQLMVAVKSVTSSSVTRFTGLNVFVD